MELTVKAFAEKTGVSVRTLHHYDAIGLLHPSRVDMGNGYRYYDETCLVRMQHILFYRELGFSLKEVERLLERDTARSEELLEKQKKLLLAKKQHIEQMLAALEGAQKGENGMRKMAQNEYDTLRAQYAQEVKARWGDTKAYAEYTEKNSGPQGADALNAVFAEFAALKRGGEAPDGDAAQALAKRLQDTITAHFYTCTDAILAGLGRMYTADERFAMNIDKNGEGTAAFASAAIAAFCKQ